MNWTPTLVRETVDWTLLSLFKRLQLISFSPPKGGLDIFVPFFEGFTWFHFLLRKVDWTFLFLFLKASLDFIFSSERWIGHFCPFFRRLHLISFSPPKGGLDIFVPFFEGFTWFHFLLRKVDWTFLSLFEGFTWFHFLLRKVDWTFLSLFSKASLDFIFSSERCGAWWTASFGLRWRNSVPPASLFSTPRVNTTPPLRSPPNILTK